jgi:hypothetical protein
MSDSLFSTHKHVPDSAQKCLDKTFRNDAERLEYYRGGLRKALSSSEYRHRNDFPVADDSTLIDLSNPPYFTPCPNPFLETVIQCHTKTSSSSDQYERDPFATDVSEGRGDALYNAHGYHTKVPHKAIMRYILHYTEPDDIVFDGFCGTGMTGQRLKALVTRLLTMGIFVIPMELPSVESEVALRSFPIYRPSLASLLQIIAFLRIPNTWQKDAARSCPLPNRNWVGCSPRFMALLPP